MADALTPVLTDEQIDALWVSTPDDPDGNEFVPFARAVEAAVLAAQAPAQQAEAVAVTTEAELRKLRGSCVGSKLATVFHPDAPGFGVKLCTHPAPSQPDWAVMQQALEALRLLDEAYCADEYSYREGRVKGRQALIATRAAIAALEKSLAP